MTVRPARPEIFFRVDAHFGQNPIEMLMAEGEAPLSAPQAKQILSRTESSKSAHTLTPSGSRRSTPRWSSASPSRCRGAWLWPHLGQRGLLALRLIKCFGLGRRSQLAPRRAALAVSKGEAGEAHCVVDDKQHLRVKQRVRRRASRPRSPSSLA